MQDQINIRFSPPDITEEEINEVCDALRSGWITTGPRTKEFERNLADYCQTGRAVCLNSQTACAEMALRLLGIGPGDEVITSAYTYTASASVICHVGATPVLVDTRKDSVEMDYDRLEAAITERTKAIIPVDIAGVPCEYDTIFDIVEQKRRLFRPNGDIQRALGRVVVSADAAHALGAEYHGKKVGSVADFTSFSFHAVKNLTTAEGGALMWRPVPGVDDETIYHRLQLLSLHGQSKDAITKTKLGQWEYDIAGTWYKCNMTDISAAIGLAQLRRYPGLLARRRELVEKYDRSLKPAGMQVMEHLAPDRLSSCHLYITRVPGADSGLRSYIITEMAKKGIACNVHYKPLPLLTAYRELGFDISDYPNAHDFFRNEITLPLHTLLTDEEADYVTRCYLEIIGSCV